MDPLVPSRTAVVLVDLIEWLAGSDGFTFRTMRAEGRADEADYLEARCRTLILPRLRRLLDRARAVGVTVIHVRLASRHADHADIVAPLRPFVEAAEARDGTPACEPLAGLSAPVDLSIVKTGSGAFAGTDLDMLLRRLGIDTVLYAGTLTNACVLLTAAAGYDLGYRQFLLSDGTGAFNDQDQADAERLLAVYVAEPVTCQAALSALPAT